MKKVFHANDNLDIVHSSGTSRSNIFASLFSLPEDSGNNRSKNIELEKYISYCTRHRAIASTNLSQILFETKSVNRKKFSLIGKPS